MPLRRAGGDGVRVCVLQGPKGSAPWYPGPRGLSPVLLPSIWEQGERWPSLWSPNRQLSMETACDRRVKEERGIKAALILQGEDMSADSYLGTLRYQNP